VEEAETHNNARESLQLSELEQSEIGDTGFLYIKHEAEHTLCITTFLGNPLVFDVTVEEGSVVTFEYAGLQFRGRLHESIGGGFDGSFFQYEVTKRLS